MAIAGTVEDIDPFRDALVRRGLALALDLVVLSLLAAFLTALFGVDTITRGVPPSPSSPDGLHNFGYTTVLPVPAWSFPLVLGVAYFLFFEVAAGRTPGKLFARVRPVRLDGSTPNTGQVILRNLTRVVDFFAWPALLFMCGLVVLDAKRQRLGDLVSGTSVLTDADASHPLPRRWKAWVAIAVVAAGAVPAACLFDYYGRPPLDVAGMYQRGQFIEARVTSYSLGRPAFGHRTVRYPVDVTTTNQGRCRANVTLEFKGTVPFGRWSFGSADMVCERPPATPTGAQH